MLQALGQGYIRSLKEMRDVIYSSFEVLTFEPRREEDWEEAYGRFREISRRAP